VDWAEAAVGAIARTIAVRSVRVKLRIPAAYPRGSRFTPSGHVTRATTRG
jgi:hypothetical protein